jgi:putative DNA methylase
VTPLLRGRLLRACADYWTSLTCWIPVDQKVGHTFSRQALSMVWDFVEAVPFEEIGGGFDRCLVHVVDVLDAVTVVGAGQGTAECASATSLPQPNDAVDAVITDPPYYDSVPYAYLSDFFYVWLRRSLHDLYPSFMSTPLTEKARECVYNPAALSADGLPKDGTYFREQMRAAMTEARRVTKPNGIAVVVFAHKSTAGWEAQLQAMLDAGWQISASWPLDTERPGRLRAHGSAALASSIHLVCRPREFAIGADGVVGSWRTVLAELPVRIHDWMPRLADEGVVGADAIFACLGPALEVFSRYDRVEKASGEVVALKQYLEEVWAAVSKEALSLMFEGADASGLEEDARLTAMWLWTLGAGAYSGTPESVDTTRVGEDDEDDGVDTSGSVLPGFLLEYDAARKIAQGLGAQLEKLTDVVEVKGEKARLLSVAERARSLFTKDAGSSGEAAQAGRKKAKPSRKQLGLFAEIEAAEKEGLLGKGGIPKVGETTLDRLHQSMILFGAGRSEALKRFVVEEGVGKDGRFWKLAQSLSALYPAGSDEKRWVDGVLARKKGLGFG